jgi:hypothetical protein
VPPVSFFAFCGLASGLALVIELMAANANPNPSSELVKKSREDLIPLLKIMLALSAVGALVSAFV